MASPRRFDPVRAILKVAAAHGPALVTCPICGRERVEVTARGTFSRHRDIRLNRLHRDTCVMFAKPVPGDLLVAWTESKEKRACRESIEAAEQSLRLRARSAELLAKADALKAVIESIPDTTEKTK